MISDVYFPRVNGVSTSILTFTRCFLSQGHEVSLIAPTYLAAHQDEFDIIRIPSWQVPLDPEDQFMHVKHIKSMLPELANAGYEVLHIHTPFVAHYAGRWLARKLGIPLVLSYHTFFEAYLEKYMPWVPHGILRRTARSISRNQCNEVDGIVSPSNQMLEKLHEYGVEQQARVIPTGIPLDRFQLAEHNTFRQQYGLPEDAFVMLYLGRVAHEKNIGFLIDMFVEVNRRAPHARLIIAGEGPAESSLQKHAERTGLGDKIHFIGYLRPLQAVVDCYAASDLFVFASETETQGLVLLEAMACNTPVVSCASLGSKDVLQDGEGCIISPLDIETFADHVCSLTGNPERLASLAERGRAYVDGWSDSSQAIKMLGFYQDLIDARSSTD